MLEPCRESLPLRRYLLREPRIGIGEREPAAGKKPLQLVGSNPATCSVAHQGVEQLAKAEAGLVQLQDRRLADRLLVVAGHVDEQRQVVEPAPVRLEREQHVEEAAAEGDDWHREVTRAMARKKTVDKRRVACVFVEPYNGAPATQLADKLILQGLADGTYLSH